MADLIAAHEASTQVLTVRAELRVLAYDQKTPMDIAIKLRELLRKLDAPSALLTRLAKEAP